ncbi:MAG: hypothetical protein HQL51_07945 [Magnetococcales bacterium]|nr:hypothetical protein [Magnetococcales bacterium]
MVIVLGFWMRMAYFLSSLFGLHGVHHEISAMGSELQLVMIIWAAVLTFIPFSIGLVVLREKRDILAMLWMGMYLHLCIQSMSEQYQRESNVAKSIERKGEIKNKTSHCMSKTMEQQSECLATLIEEYRTYHAH